MWCYICVIVNSYGMDLFEIGRDDWERSVFGKISKI